MTHQKNARAHRTAPVPMSLHLVSLRRAALRILALAIACSTASALEPDEILIIVNSRNEISQRIARYYCDNRKVPDKNILKLDLPDPLREELGRYHYEKQLAEPIQKEIRRRLPGDIRCLLTTYGIPLRVGPRTTLPGKADRLSQLKTLIKNAEQQLEQLRQNQAAENKKPTDKAKQLQQNIARLKIEADWIAGRETHASVDSELSMVLAPPYELYRWRPNDLRADTLALGLDTMMVSRLDGPDYLTIKGLVDKAIAAEKTGLHGAACIDSRGLKGTEITALYDKALRDLAAYLRENTDLPVKEQTTPRLFDPNSCPDTALYCGWYSLKKYVDAFDFVDGAVGYHIASFEAQGLRDPNSTAWCPAMIRDGITATLGAVNEPYLHTIPNPRAFFPELLNGRCLAEAYYRTKPFNSWQLLLIGDPLYKPFAKKSATQ